MLKKNRDISETQSLDFMFSLAVAYQGYNKPRETNGIIEEILSINSSHVGAHKLKSSTIKYSYENKESTQHLNEMEKLNNNHLNDNEKIENPKPKIIP